jgi:hypothetical protein
MIAKGYVAIFSEPHSRASVIILVESWLERFQKVEQVTPESGSHVGTLLIQKNEDLMWTDHLQFRVTNGDEFTWVYLTLNRYAIETTGLPSDEVSLCLDVLLEITGVTEIIEGHNHRRLDQCEAEGLL